MATPPGNTTIAGRLVGTGEPIEVYLADGRIAAIRLVPGSAADLPWLGPGLVDLQVNGYAGLDFNAPPVHDLAGRLTRALWREGVTTYLPTIITSDDATIAARLRIIATARATDPLLTSTIGGIHLEGPFISPEDGPRGAHDRAQVRPPDWDSFQRWQGIADGAIRLVTLAPEWPGAPDFIARCVASGVAVALGHTAATAEQIDAAIAAGARLSTHFGNGAHPVLPRHPNYLWDQLARDELAASLIGDGWHLPDAVLRVVLRVKGPDAWLVSDTVALAGQPPGDYTTPVGDRVTLTPEGRLHLAGESRLLAGSVCPLRGAIAHLVGRAIAPLDVAWAMASIRPARFLGLEAGQGLVPGAPADLVAFTSDGTTITVQRTYKGGRPVYDREAEGEDGQAIRHPQPERYA